MNESEARNLAALYERRRRYADMIDYARRSDVFREAAEKQFGGTGLNSSLRDAMGGTDSLGTYMKRAVIDALTDRHTEVCDEITKAGGEL